MLWDFFAWVGIATLATFSLWFIHGVMESVIVARIGWTRLKRLGFWRSIPAAIRGVGMKCKFGVGCGTDGGMFRCETRQELAEHMLTVHADYFAERPEAAVLWRRDLT